ncbi:MAG: hypothetical protein DHS20C12_10810 [Pseudohongiella sp.]|nr:MAG: hypothetical protein DHS20C12_10810 [Pseudohongiella sp.]
MLLILSLLFCLALLSNVASAQGLSFNLTEDLVPAEKTASRAPAAETSDFSAYDQRQVESLGDMGRLSHSTGEHEKAAVLFKQALHIARINQGLYHESQISIVDDIISAEIALQDWEEVNNYYAYQEHLYHRLYDIDDPRLELGLQKVSGWHITAVNVNLDGKRIEHLRKANQLFKLRMQVAQNTLSQDDPKLRMLSKNIEIFERELFLASDLNREMLIKQRRDPDSRRSSFRQGDRRMVVTND